MNWMNHRRTLYAATGLVVALGMADPAAATPRPPFFLTSDRVTFRFGMEADHPGTTRIETGHTDARVTYRLGGTFAPDVDGDDGTFPTTGATLYGNTGARVTLGTIPPQFAFIGATPNQPFWVLPQGQSPGVIYLGIAADNMTTGDRNELVDWNPGDPRGGANVARKWIEVRLIDLRGPSGGHFSLWQTGSGGQVTAYMSTFNGGVDPTDRVHVQAGGHAHFNWGFTQPGLYELDVQLRTFTDDDRIPGDADLNGVIDFDDYARIDTGFLSGGLGWGNGDFDGNGEIDFDDYAIIDNSFLGGGFNFIPEPSLALPVVSMLIAFARRRRAGGAVPTSFPDGSVVCVTTSLD
jgi:surface-anchored protein